MLLKVAGNRYMECIFTNRELVNTVSEQVFSRSQMQKFFFRCQWFSVMAAIISLAGLAEAQQYSEVSLHNFVPPPKGAVPRSGVVSDASGNLYGTAYSGGTVNQGVVYKVSLSGVVKVLHSFSGGLDGAYPIAGVTLDGSGNIYGTTSAGGGANVGVVYEIDTSGHETVLYSFTGGSDGGIPFGGVVLDSAENAYGTTLEGGPYYAGVVFKVTPAGQETVLYSFTGGADGSGPEAGLIRDSKGDLYGTTSAGGLGEGDLGNGTVYKLSASGLETVLYSFKGGTDGQYPEAGLARDSSGNLYGTTFAGGSGNNGVVFKIGLGGAETVLHPFSGGSDGAQPQAGITLDASGNIYGTTAAGGLDYGGVVFELSPAGQETVLFSFNFFSPVDGSSPHSTLIFGAGGDLFGTTEGGGPANAGVLFKLTLTGQQSVVFGFPSGSDGTGPEGSLARDSSGNLYGATNSGGMGYGTVYKVSPTGKETVLHTFTGGADGGYPFAGVTLDSSENLYGTTGGGGVGAGVVYKIDPNGQETILYTFTGGSDGDQPQAGVTLDSAGNIYGTTGYGGNSFDGVVFRVDTAGAETVLHSFSGNDGQYPFAGLTLDSEGNLYGTTFSGGAFGQGTVYEITAAGIETVLYSFAGGSTGSLPQAGVVRDAAGNLYGTAEFGGPGGVVFSLTPAGVETILHTFEGSPNDGALPLSGLIKSSGVLYGTTSMGGSSNMGTVFSVTTSGGYSVLYNFAGAPDGSEPRGDLIRDSAGDLYGTTFSGGSKSAGEVFKLKP